MTTSNATAALTENFELVETTIAGPAALRPMMGALGAFGVLARRRATG